MSSAYYVLNRGNGHVRIPRRKTFAWGRCTRHEWSPQEYAYSTRQSAEDAARRAQGVDAGMDLVVVDREGLFREIGVRDPKVPPPPLAIPHALAPVLF